MANLLATKLYFPSIPPKRIGRPHLIQRLNEGLQAGRQITLVSAPAGFGKTTCISEWLNTVDFPVTWLSLDPSDDDPGQFFTYLTAALQKVDKEFLIGITGIITAGTQPTTLTGWFTPLQNNWLVVLYKLNAGFSGVQPNLLNVLNLLDIVIMILFGTMSLALYIALRQTNKIWSAVAASLPFLGILVFLVTSTAGRSGLLIGGLIFSAAMLRSHVFSKVGASMGIVASVLLFFAGDLGTAIFSASMIIAVLMGIGYVLWMIWFLLIARQLLQLGQVRLEKKQ